MTCRPAARSAAGSKSWPGAATKTWTLHIGASFTDVLTSSGFYRFIETLLHKGVTGGCGVGIYCPSASTAREQMAVFVLVAKEGPGYQPPACTTPIFNDVPASSPFCRGLDELSRRGGVTVSSAVLSQCVAGRVPAVLATR